MSHPFDVMEHRGVCRLLKLIHTMMGPGRSLAAAFMLAAAGGGCFSPSYDECRVACTSDEDCAPGQSCGAAGMCVGSGDPLACSPAIPDAPPVSPVGTYDLVLTNQENGCAFDNWVVGSTSNIDVKVSRVAALLMGEMLGSMATILKSWLGTSTFSGPPQGARLELTLLGIKDSSQLNCVFTFDLTFDATLDGDMVDGSMFYRARTNGASGCGVLTGCVSRQALRGTRTSP